MAEERTGTIAALVEAVGALAQASRRVDEIIGDDPLLVATVEGIDGLGTMLSAKGELPLFEEWIAAFSAADRLRALLLPEEEDAALIALLTDPIADGLAYLS